jgi:hypothetical protein
MRRRVEIDTNWPDPVSDPIGHTLAVYGGAPPDDFVIVATSNVYGDGVRTGITWGDLRRQRELILELAGHLENYSDDVARYMGDPGFRTETIQGVLERARNAVKNAVES